MPCPYQDRGFKAHGPVTLVTIIEGRLDRACGYEKMPFRQAMELVLPEAHVDEGFSDSRFKRPFVQHVNEEHRVLEWFKRLVPLEPVVSERQCLDLLPPLQAGHEIKVHHLQVACTSRRPKLFQPDRDPSSRIGESVGQDEIEEGHVPHLRPLYSPNEFLMQLGIEIRVEHNRNLQAHWVLIALQLAEILLDAACCTKELPQDFATTRGR
jgi:hypothetical protein